MPLELTVLWRVGSDELSDIIVGQALNARGHNEQGGEQKFHVESAESRRTVSLRRANAEDFISTNATFGNLIASQKPTNERQCNQSRLKMRFIASTIEARGEVKVND
jgi:hypothetical protein